MTKERKGAVRTMVVRLAGLHEPGFELGRIVGLIEACLDGGERIHFKPTSSGGFESYALEFWVSEKQERDLCDLLRARLSEGTFLNIGWMG